MEITKLEQYFSDDEVDDCEILFMMLDNLHKSIMLSDRCMVESNIKLIYVYLIQNYELLTYPNAHKKIIDIIKPINDLSSNTFLRSIMEWTDMTLNKRPNRKDLPPISEETRKIMESKAILIDESLQSKYKWQADNPEKKQILRKPPAKFKINDIVGVKDKEHKWCLARVLIVIEDDDFHTPWYYVHFHNWSNSFREWIGDANRIKPYMAKRDHFQK